MTVPEAMALPEKDGWLYTGLENDGRSYVCSAYVTAVYKAAGIFGDLDVQATEFTPRDIYNMNIFRDSSDLPE